MDRRFFGQNENETEIRRRGGGVDPNEERRREKTINYMPRTDVLCAKSLQPWCFWAPLLPEVELGNLLHRRNVAQIPAGGGLDMRHRDTGARDHCFNGGPSRVEGKCTTLVAKSHVAVSHAESFVSGGPGPAGSFIEGTILRFRLLGCF